MRRFIGLLLLIIFISIFVCCSKPDISEFARLKGPYLGQNPPGMTPEIFAPGIISTGLDEQRISFSKDGNEIFFNSYFRGSFTKDFLFHACINQGRWIEPKEFYFQADRPDFGRSILNYDGSKLFFQSRRPDKNLNGQSTTLSIWYMERIRNAWSTPEKIHWGEDFPFGCSHPSVAANGNLYFQRASQGGKYGADIFMSEYEDGKYAIPVKLSDAVNGPGHDCHPHIAPDESYLIFDGYRPGKGYGKTDLYISFRNADGEWGAALNMGPRVNTPGIEKRAFVTYDGKYLFFISHGEGLARLPEHPVTLAEVENISRIPENGLYDFYWVDARIIEALKPDESYGGLAQ